MIIIPKENPIIKDLNSYYLNVSKLFEHYQGVVDSGCIYFKSPSSEGAVFFDEENLINGVYRNKKNLTKGKQAIELLMAESGTNNFSIAIYEIIPERITYWANIADAEDLHKDLSTEFTDLEGLINKMVSEKLTGYIDVSFNEKEKGVLFFLNGGIIGSTSTKDRMQLKRSEDFQIDLINRSRESGAVLNVRKITLKHMIENYSPVVKSSEESVSTVPPAETKPEIKEKPLNFIDMLQQLMLIYEKFIIGNKKIRDDFDTILKRKFMEKVNKFDFLDPFAAEFQYTGGKIEYFGKTDHKELAEGLMECLQEISVENGMVAWLKKHLMHWEERYSREINMLKTRLY